MRTSLIGGGQTVDLPFWSVISGMPFLDGESKLFEPFSPALPGAEGIFSSSDRCETTKGAPELVEV